MHWVTIPYYGRNMADLLPFEYALVSLLS
jgi:hypothetical protein